MGKKMVEMFRLKRLIQNLESARGNGTSMITLIAPPGDQISQLTRLLTDEQGSASNIKSRVNRLSVLSAITSALQRLKQMSSVPENGLALFTGNVVLSDGKEKKVTYVIEPHRPLNTSLYMCDSRFHVDALRDLLSNDDSFGFIIVDGNGVLYGKLTGNHKETLHKFTVELPKKHGRGGQSAVRFARLRMEARHNYVRKVAEHAVQHFITNDRPNVQGIILAGSADFKNELAKSDLFDPRLLEVVIKTVDISYGGEAGFAQAIELSAESLANVALVKEKKLLAEYFEHIALDTNKITYGIKDTMMGLEMGAVETLIIWEDLEIDRIVLVDPASGSETIKFLNKEQQASTSSSRSARSSSSGSQTTTQTLAPRSSLSPTVPRRALSSARALVVSAASSATSSTLQPWSTIPRTGTRTLTSTLLTKEGFKGFVNA